MNSNKNLHEHLARLARSQKIIWNTQTAKSCESVLYGYMLSLLCGEAKNLNQKPKANRHITISTTSNCSSSLPLKHNKRQNIHTFFAVLLNYKWNDHFVKQLSVSFLLWFYLLVWFVHSLIFDDVQSWSTAKYISFFSSEFNLSFCELDLNTYSSGNHNCTQIIV